MAATQQIYRQADPTAQAIQQAGNSVTEALQKQQALKLTGQYYKILSKNADTEQQKAHLDRLSKLTSDFLPQIAATDDPATKSMLIKAVVDSGLYGGDHQQFFKDMATVQPQVDTNHQSVSGQPMGGGQQQQPQQGAQQVPVQNQLAAQMAAMRGGQYASPGQLAAQQGQEAQANAGLASARANAINNPASVIQNIQGATQGQGGQQGGGPPNVNDAMNQGLTVSGADISPYGGVGIQMTSPRTQALETMAREGGTTSAEKQFQFAPPATI